MRPRFFERETGKNVVGEIMAGKRFPATGHRLRGITTITNRRTVHARGLWFLDAGTYKLVAARIMTP